MESAKSRAGSPSLPRSEREQWEISLVKPVEREHHLLATIRAVKTWRYGLTLLPREKTSEDQSSGVIEAVVRCREDLGWELVRVTERDDSELLVFRRPA